MKMKNMVAALFLIGFGLIYGYHSAHLPTRTLPNSPDPSFFPWLLTVILLFLSSVLLFQSLKQPSPKTEKKNKFKLSEPAAGLTVFFAYIIILPWFGFLLVSIPFFVSMLIIYGERRKSWWIIFSLGIPLFLFILFQYFFQIPLPRAELFQ
ncbi:MAG: tripartite tricarboxylate transporter TctB family protein [SAR324 cluster bacterium]|nr:tripartite tricarboxylate transporter TctB family protein [SAR324 cluster bacterium]